MPGPRMLILMALPVVVAVVIILLRGGRWTHLGRLRLRHPWLVWAAAGVQFLRLSEPSWVADLLPVIAIWLLASAFVAVNLRSVPARARPWLVVFATGYTANTAAVAANGGMPFSARAAELAGFSAAEIASPKLGHPPLTADSALMPLADLIPVPLLQRVVSVGDLFMILGATLLLAALTRTPQEGGGTRAVTA